MRHQNISLHAMIKGFKGWKHKPALIKEPQMQCSINQSSWRQLVTPSVFWGLWEQPSGGAFVTSWLPTDDEESRIGILVIYLPHSDLKSALWAFFIWHSFKNVLFSLDWRVHLFCITMTGNTDNTSSDYPEMENTALTARCPPLWLYTHTFPVCPTIRHEPNPASKFHTLWKPHHATNKGLFREPWYTRPHSAQVCTAFRPLQTCIVSSVHGFWPSERVFWGSFINSSGPLARGLNVKPSGSGEGDPKQLDLDVRCVSGIHKQLPSIACKR